MAKKEHTKKHRGTGTFIACLILAVLLALGCRFAVFETVTVTTDAMAPDYTAGDTIFVNKLTLWKSFDVKRGDAVYADFKSGSCRLIRRVAGVEGDLIDVRDDGFYLLPAEGGELFLGDAPGLQYGTLPYGAYLLLGNGSGPDSRELGLVYRTDILGIPGKIIIDR